MKATGVVRRIDDLGRVVIPKEVRRTLGIREGDPLEIFVSREGEVMLKKYAPLGETLEKYARIAAESLFQQTGNGMGSFVTENESVLFSTGPKKNQLKGEDIALDFSVIAAGEITMVELPEIGFAAVCPVMHEETPVGCVGVYAENQEALTEDIKRNLKFMASFLSKRMLH